MMMMSEECDELMTLQNRTKKKSDFFFLILGVSVGGNYEKGPQIYYPSKLPIALKAKRLTNSSLLRKSLYENIT